MEGWRKGVMPLMFQAKMRRRERSGIIWEEEVVAGGIEVVGGGVERQGESRRRLVGGGLMSGMLMSGCG